MTTLSEQLDARRWILEAVAFYKTKGKQATFREINKRDGQFAQNGCYLFAANLEGKMLAHPMKKLRGKSLIDLRDSLGKSFIRKIVDISMKYGGGSTEYEWPLPGREIEGRKRTIFEKVDDIIFCCGYFDSDEPSYDSLCERLFGPLE